MNFLMNQKGRNSLISIRNSWIVKVTWKEILKKRWGKCIVYVLVCPSLEEHPRRPRGGQSGRDKRRRKFPKTGERAPGMLLLTNQFHNSVECLSLIGHKNRRPASIALLSWSSYRKELTCKLDFSPYLAGSCRRAFKTGHRQNDFLLL